MDGPTFHLHRGDAVARLRALPSESIDLVITDPPYESLEKHRAVGTTTRLKHSKASSNDWFEIFPNERFPELFAEVHRVLKRNTHFYLFCDPETMFVAKPLAEAAGFKFWKPVIWDKCLAPDTLVWTARGAIRIDEIVPGDRVAIPEGGTAEVRATRRTRAPSVRLTLSDGTTLVASNEHRFMLADGTLVEASMLRTGSRLLARPVRIPTTTTLDLDRVIPEEDAVHEVGHSRVCLWCGVEFDTVRGCAAHQARFCGGISKATMAQALGVRPKRLRRWLGRGRIPRCWAKSLGLESKLGPRIQCYLQNDAELWYPRHLELDHDLGRFIGLYAAEGSKTACGVTFACHASEKHLQAHLARIARSLGVRARVRVEGARCSVRIDFKIVKHIVNWFVGGDSATTKFLKEAVYAAPEAFRRGVLAGLEEGDGHWSHEEQRHTYVSASRDLTMFVCRELEAAGKAPTLSRFENDHAGGWKVRHDPIRIAEAPTVVAVEPVGELDLVDISIADRAELFLLANGVVTHNCSIGMGYHYRARYECVLFFEKGKRKLADLGIADILEAKRIMGGYPAEKPPEVSEVLIKQSSDKGQIVADPFMGSGSVGVAAIRNGRSFLGNDLCAEAVDITRGRLLELGGRELHDAGAVKGPAQQGLTL